jgi:dephospho-CoA kinase
LARADDVIVNEKSLKAVSQQVQKLHAKYLRCASG